MNEELLTRQKYLYVTIPHKPDILRWLENGKSRRQVMPSYYIASTTILSNGRSNYCHLQHQMKLQNTFPRDKHWMWLNWHKWTRCCGSGIHHCVTKENPWLGLYFKTVSLLSWNENNQHMLILQVLAAKFERTNRWRRYRNGRLLSLLAQPKHSSS